MTTPVRLSTLTPADTAATPTERHIPHSVMRDANGRLAFDMPPREIRDALVGRANIDARGRRIPIGE